MHYGCVGSVSGKSRCVVSCLMSIYSSEPVVSYVISEQTEQRKALFRVVMELTIVKQLL